MSDSVVQLLVAAEMLKQCLSTGGDSSSLTNAVHTWAHKLALPTKATAGWFTEQSKVTAAATLYICSVYVTINPLRLSLSSVVVCLVHGAAMLKVISQTSR